MNKATRNVSPLNILIHVAALMAVLLLASNVSAQECETNEDCGEGFVCEIWASGGGSSVTCTVDENGNETCSEEEEPVEEFYGECVRGPIECEVDADCPSGLSCVLGGTATPEPAPAPCPEDAECEDEGLWEGGDEDPAPESGYCAWIPQECASDDDCGEGFECEVIGGSDCAVPACPPGEDCPDVDCGEPTEERACVPREIECETDSQCPSDWSCVTFTEGYCEGSTGSGSGGSDGGEGFAPEPDEDTDGDSDGDSDPDGDREDSPGAEEEDAFCYEETYSLCAPPGWDQGGGIGVPGSDGHDDQTTGEPREENDDAPSAPNGGGDDGGSVFDGDDNGDGSAQDGGTDDEDGGGCTVSSVNGKAGGTGALALLLGMMLVAARRRK